MSADRKAFNYVVLSNGCEVFFVCCDEAVVLLLSLSLFIYFIFSLDDVTLHHPCHIFWVAAGSWAACCSPVCCLCSDHMDPALSCLSTLHPSLPLLPFFSPLPLSLSSLFFIQSHANTLSGSISADWIDSPQGFCWLRRCQIWWVIGKLCLAATLSGLVIHFVNPDL